LLRQSGIIVRPRMSMDLLIQELLQAKLMLYFGHKDETFCLAASEAMACGLPVVTRGIGSLAERVGHNKNGIVSGKDSVLAHSVLDLLADASRWNRLSCCAYDSVQGVSWARQAKHWEEAILND